MLLLSETNSADTGVPPIAFSGRIFSVPLARIFLAMSALVYERRDALVNEAADIAYAASKKYAKGTTQYDLEMTRAENKLSESEERIKREAAKWGLAYDGVSDLSSVAGPFASMFYTPIGFDQRPFIVLCFKGTFLLFSALFSSAL